MKLYVRRLNEEWLNTLLSDNKYAFPHLQKDKLTLVMTSDQAEEFGVNIPSRLKKPNEYMSDYGNYKVEIEDV
jgi:hypothetical protein